MISPFEVWRRTALRWSIPLVFCLLNLAAFGVYRAYFAGQVPALQETYGVASDQMSRLQDEKAQIEGFLERADEVRESVDGLYGERFATEAERFTRTVLEIKNRARQAGLDPGAISYPRTDLSEYDLVKRNIVFSVEGTYEQLRTFINFLELSDEFLTLESVSLGDRGLQQDARNPRLSIQLSLSTVFVDEKRSAERREREQEDDA